MLKKEFESKNGRIVFDIILLIILLVIYFSIDPIVNKLKKSDYPDRKQNKIKTQGIMPSQTSGDIAELKGLNETIEKINKENKDDVISFLLHSEAGDKLKGLLIISEGDKGVDIYINDNLKMNIKKNQYPVTVFFKSAIYKIVDQSFYAETQNSDDDNAEGFLVKKDIVVENHGYFENEKAAVSELRDYLYNGIGQRHFTNLLNKNIETEIENKQKLLESLKWKKEMVKIIHLFLLIIKFNKISFLWFLFFH